MRDEGILLCASGNVVHNLRVVRWGTDAQPYAWATQFNAAARGCIERGEHAALVDYLAMGEAAELSVPTPEHYLPLLYVLGAQHEGEAVEIITDGIALGSISMLSFRGG